MDPRDTPSYWYRLALRLGIFSIRVRITEVRFSPEDLPKVYNGKVVRFKRERLSNVTAPEWYAHVRLEERPWWCSAELTRWPMRTRLINQDGIWFWRL